MLTCFTFRWHCYLPLGTLIGVEVHKNPRCVLLVSMVQLHLLPPEHTRGGRNKQSQPVTNQSPTAHQLLTNRSLTDLNLQRTQFESWNILKPALPTPLCRPSHRFGSGKAIPNVWKPCGTQARSIRYFATKNLFWWFSHLHWHVTFPFSQIVHHPTFSIITSRYQFLSSIFGPTFSTSFRIVSCFRPPAHARFCWAAGAIPCILACWCCEDCTLWQRGNKVSLYGNSTGTRENELN